MRFGLGQSLLCPFFGLHGPVYINLAAKLRALYQKGYFIIGYFTKTAADHQMLAFFAGFI